MNMLALLGFSTIGTLLLLVAFTSTRVIAALVLTALGGAAAGGVGHQVGPFAVDGLKTVAPVASMMMFALLTSGS